MCAKRWRRSSWCSELKEFIPALMEGSEVADSYPPSLEMPEESGGSAGLLEHECAMTAVVLLSASMTSSGISEATTTIVCCLQRTIHENNSPILGSPPRVVSEK
jgi:hypothetical protein